MSDSPGASAPNPDMVPPPPDTHIVPEGSSWFQRLGAVLFIIFCFELGLFLLIYPWTSAWTDNYFAWALPGTVQTAWHTFWNNPYVKGGVSGLGLVNVWIALTEVFGLFARRARSQRNRE